MKKLFVIGLDCADPYLIFEKYIDKLPTFKKLQEISNWGNLRSTDPPITVPAWACMVSGKTPGELGIYGFRNRRGYSYGLGVTNSLKIKKVPKVWDILGENGYKTGVVSVPPAYPPLKVNGFHISCFLTPESVETYTYPASLQTEIEDNVGKYIFDAKGFRTDDKQKLLTDLYALTENRFKTVNYLMDNKKWDFFMFVEMGIDRLHHGFWKYFDETHPRFKKNNEFEQEAVKYYQTIDSNINELINKLDDNTSVLIVSDHGAQGMIGGICLNEWLIKEGYLTLKNYPNDITRIDKLDIVWEKTTAWGEGGYYGRLFFNIKGREPNGIIEPDDFPNVKKEMIEKLEKLGDQNGTPIGTRVLLPEEIYPEIKGYPPDLIVYFGNLKWRSVGSVGHNTVWVEENDTGPDDANHAPNGMYMFNDKFNKEQKGHLNKSIYDICPLILNYFDIK